LKVFAKSMIINLASEFSLHRLLMLTIIFSLIGLNTGCEYTDFALGEHYMPIDEVPGNSWDMLVMALSGPARENLLGWIRWFTPFVLMVLFFGNSARNELFKRPELVMRYKSRTEWWLSKMLGTAMAICVFWITGFFILEVISLLFGSWSAGWSERLLSGKLFNAYQLLITTNEWFAAHSPYEYLFILLILYSTGSLAMATFINCSTLLFRNSYTVPLITLLLYFSTAHMGCFVDRFTSRWLPGTQLVFARQIDASRTILRWPLLFNITWITCCLFIGAVILNRIDIFTQKSD
jgi:hypothetical protein